MKQASKMVLKAIGSYRVRKIKVRGTEYRQYYIYVPKLLALDSAFPFKPGEKVLIRVDENRLIIEKLENFEEKSEDIVH